MTNELSVMRKVFQGLAVMAGIVLVIHGVLLLGLDLTATMRFLTVLEILIGTVTIATDTWFVLFT